MPTNTRQKLLSGKKVEPLGFPKGNNSLFFGKLNSREAHLPGKGICKPEALFANCTAFPSYLPMQYEPCKVTTAATERQLKTIETHKEKQPNSSLLHPDGQTHIAVRSAYRLWALLWDRQSWKMATREKQTLAFNCYLLVQTKKKTRLGVSSERSHLQSYVSFRSRVGVTSLFISNQSPGRGGASAAAGARGESSLRISDADLCRSHQEAGEEPTAPAQSQALPRLPAACAPN